MSQQDNNTGEKTEKASPKKLRDARQEGNVAKSRDMSQTVTTLIWALILVGMSGFFADTMGRLLLQTWQTVPELSHQTMLNNMASAAKTLLILTMAPLACVAVVGILVEFIQAGPVFAVKRITPQFNRLDPSQGVKRIFSMDNIVEVTKSMLKTGVLLVLIIILIWQYLPQIMQLPQSNLLAYINIEHHMLLLLMSWIIALFLLFSIGDWLYQKFSHAKKLRMSKYDVKKEHKQQEGDPMLKGKRKQLHRQWANQDARQATRSASALLVNPTHISIALYYQPEETAVPVISAKGEGDLAKLMRETARHEGVPIVRNIPLARALNYRGEEDDFIPEDLFQAVAEVIAWAEMVRQQSASADELDLSR